MKKKKTLSAKQRAALAKGRKVLKSLRKGRKISPAKEPIVLKRGEIMEGRKSRKGKKTAKRYSGELGRKTRHSGELGRKRRKSRRGGRFLGDFGSSFDPVQLGTDTAGIIAGAVAASFLAKMLPIKQAIIQALVPIALGGFVVSYPKLSKNRFINRCGLGGMAVGGLALTKALAPKLPLLSGADTAESVGIAIDNLPAEERAILGLLPEPDAAGEDGYGYGSEPGEMLGNQPGEMLGTDYQGTEYTGAEPGEMLGETEMITAGADGEDIFE